MQLLEHDKPPADQRRGSRVKPRLLCVDDEPHVLEGLRDILRRSFTVDTASSGLAALEVLASEPDSFAIVISDMRMPAMSGTVFLREARRIAPDATRILLTGYSDIEAAIAAVNDGHLFRFLTKPCASEILMRACAGALSQHNLVTAERVLLQQTLRGSIAALIDLFGMVSPQAAHRAVRIRELASTLGNAVGLRNLWEVEMAAMLAHIGAVTLPAVTAEKFYAGTPLSPDERELIDRLPRTPRRLLAQIPRLEAILQMIEDGAEPAGRDPSGRQSSAGARVLRIATDFDALQSTGLNADVAIGTMRTRGTYDQTFLQALAYVLNIKTVPAVTEVSLGELRPGMLLADDVNSTNGGLLVARGNPITDDVIDRLLYRAIGVREPLLVVQPNNDQASSPEPAANRFGYLQ